MSPFNCTPTSLEPSTSPSPNPSKRPSLTTERYSPQFSNNPQRYANSLEASLNGLAVTSKIPVILPFEAAACLPTIEPELEPEPQHQKQQATALSHFQRYSNSILDSKFDFHRNSDYHQAKVPNPIIKESRSTSISSSFSPLTLLASKDPQLVQFQHFQKHRQLSSSGILSPLESTSSTTANLRYRPSKTTTNPTGPSDSTSTLDGLRSVVIISSSSIISDTDSSSSPPPLNHFLSSSPPTL